MSENKKSHQLHNIRQIKNALFRGEVSLKGTAPSFFNNESDRGKPGPVSPLTGKGYDHLEAVVRSQDNADVPKEELDQIIDSLHKIVHAIAHVRRTKFDLYRATLRVQNDPGIVRRWQDGKEKDSEDWLRSYEMAAREAADYVEALWPGTRLYVPSSREDEPVESKIHGRNQDNNDTKRRDAWDRYFDLNSEVERVAQEQEGRPITIALDLYRDTLERNKKEDVSPATFWRARSIVLTIRGIAQSEGCTVERAREIHKRDLEERGKSA